MTPIRITPPSVLEKATAASCTAVRLKPLLRSTKSLSDGNAPANSDEDSPANSDEDMNSGSGAVFERWNGGYAIVLVSIRTRLEKWHISRTVATQRSRLLPL